MNTTLTPFAQTLSGIQHALHTGQPNVALEKAMEIDQGSLSYAAQADVQLVIARAAYQACKVTEWIGTMRQIQELILANILPPPERDRLIAHHSFFTIWEKKTEARSLSQKGHLEEALKIVDDTSLVVLTCENHLRHSALLEPEQYAISMSQNRHYLTGFRLNLLGQHERLIETAIIATKQESMARMMATGQTYRDRVSGSTMIADLLLPSRMSLDEFRQVCADDSTEGFHASKVVFGDAASWSDLLRFDTNNTSRGFLRQRIAGGKMAARYVTEGRETASIDGGLLCTCIYSLALDAEHAQLPQSVSDDLRMILAQLLDIFKEVRISRKMFR